MICTKGRVISRCDVSKRILVQRKERTAALFIAVSDDLTRHDVWHRCRVGQAADNLLAHHVATDTVDEFVFGVASLIQGLQEAITAELAGGRVLEAVRREDLITDGFVADADTDVFGIFTKDLLGYERLHRIVQKAHLNGLLLVEVRSEHVLHILHATLEGAIQFDRGDPLAADFGNFTRGAQIEHRCVQAPDHEAQCNHAKDNLGED